MKRLARACFTAPSFNVLLSICHAQNTGLRPQDLRDYFVPALELRLLLESPLGRVSTNWGRHPRSPQGVPLGPCSVGDDRGPSLTLSARSGFSYVDLVEGLHDGHFYALKRILCHEQQDVEEAQREADMHRLFSHPNILHLVAYCLKERGSKHEAWLLLPYLKVRKSPGYGGLAPGPPTRAV